MADSPTTRNRLRKQEVGAKTNAWGTDWNEDGGSDRLDEAMDGYVAFSLSGSKTLTSTNYESDEARMRVINVTGGTGGTVTIPAVEKWYLVINGSSGDVTISNGSNSVVVKSGNVTPVTTNGTAVYLGQTNDYGSTVPKSSGTPTVGDHLVNKTYADSLALGVPGLDPNVQTWMQTPSSANLRTAVTDETGTGALVFATSPTIAAPTVTGTASFATLSTSSNVTVGGALSVSGGTTVSALTATGNAVISGTLSISGTTAAQTVNAVNIATTAGANIGTNALIGGTLGVTGTTTLGSMNASGNVTVGGAFGVTGVAGFGTGSTDGQVNIFSNGAPSLAIDTFGATAAITTDKNNTSGAFHALLYNSSLVGDITTDGSNVYFTSLSDERQKMNIVPAPSASDIIDGLEVVSFDWLNGSGHVEFGLIAQQVHPVYPDPVRPGGVTDPWRLDPAKFVPLLLKEIQSLRGRVAALEA